MYRERGRETERDRERERESKARPTIILNPHRSTSPVLTNLIVPVRENPRLQTVVKHGVMVILLVAAVAAAAAVAQVVFECDVGGGGVVGVVADVVLGPVAVLVVDALGLAGVDVGVVPEGEGGVGGHGVVGVVFVAD